MQTEPVPPGKATRRELRGSQQQGHKAAVHRDAEEAGAGWGVSELSGFSLRVLKTLLGYNTPNHF